MLQLFLPLKAVKISFMHVYKPIAIEITQDARQNIVDAPLMLIARMGQWPCRLVFCQGRLPVRWLKIAATRSHFNYRTYKTRNDWRSSDADFQDGAGSMMLLLLTWQAANTSFTNGCNHLPLRLPKMHSQKSLRLHWRSSSEWGSERIVYSFAKKGCQYVGYG